MPDLSFELPNLNEIDDSLKGLYTQVNTDDGKELYRLNVKDVKPLQEFKVVHETMLKERKLHNEMESKLKAFGEFTPEQVNAMKDELESYKTNGNAKNEEFVKKVEEIRNDSANKINTMKLEYENKIKKLSDEVAEKTALISDMNKTTALKQAFAEKGDPAMFEAFCLTAKSQIEFDEDSKKYKTVDKLYTLDEFVDTLFSKMPGFMKPSLSASAREGVGNSTGWDQYFDPKSDKYNLDKQAELFHKDRARALEYRKKYSSI